MKIERTFSIEIDGAVFTFKRPTIKDIVQFKTEDPIANVLFILSKLEKVSGAQFADGGDVTVEIVRSADLDNVTVTKILSAWNKEILRLQGREEESAEKKS